MRTKRHLFAVAMACLLMAGCSSNPTATHPGPIIEPPPPPTPEGAIRQLIGAYEQKKSSEYQVVFTGDFTYEFSTSTDPTLVQQYSAGWFKNDEKESSAHLFNGYTPPGGQPLPAAATINIKLAVDLPSDDNSAGVDPITHKVLATRVDGTVTVPEQGAEPLTYAIVNNYNVFYLVRGDVAVNLDSTQKADSLHWYIYRWVDLSEATAPAPTRGPTPAKSTTWGAVKAEYR